MRHFSIAYAAWLGLACTAMAPLLKADMWNKRKLSLFTNRLKSRSMC